jgi:hypothetical protein
MQRIEKTGVERKTGSYSPKTRKAHLRDVNLIY